MRISYIVSAFNSSRFLPCLLGSLAVQTDQDFEVLVTDNTVDEDKALAIRRVCRISDVKHIRYVNTRQTTCYHSAETGVGLVQGEFVCFPSDDNYYMPTFGEAMYRTASANGADLVLCEMIFDGRRGGRYSVMDTKAAFGHVDKGGFILRRDKFQPFPGKPDTDIPCGADGMLIDQLVASGISHIKLPDILVVHN